MIQKTDRNTYWFVFIGGSLLLKRTQEGTLEIPLSYESPTHTKEWTVIQALPPMNDGTPCASYKLDTPPANIEEFETIGLRESYNLLPLAHYLMAGKAAELIYWDENTRYCGNCGAPMKRSTDISKQCCHCGKEVWPQVAPAIIVRIRRINAEGKEEVLLVRAKNFKRQHYGLVAGFVETGETLEECIVREVKEEIGITVKNIRYFGSQPWPYPSGIMIGYTADYDSGEIHIQEEELTTAGWFAVDNLPPLPDKLSIARQLIDKWIDDTNKNRG